MKVRLLSTDFKCVLDRLPATIGRGASAGVRLGDREISRIHCQIEELDGHLAIRDLGSTNGTFVNWLRVTEAALISGDRVPLGQTRFWVLYERDTSRADAHEMTSSFLPDVAHPGCDRW